MDGLCWEVTSCPLCGSREEEEVLTVRCPEGPCRLARCLACGMTFTNPRVNEATIGLLYPDDYEPFQGPEDGRKARAPGWLERLVLSRYHEYPPAQPGLLKGALAWLARPFVGPPRGSMTRLPYTGSGRLLELGCGSGWLAHRLARMGWEVVPMDFSSHAVDQVRKRYGLEGIVGTLPHPRVEDGTFDAVTMGAVLEHVHDPHRMIAAAARALRPGGRMLIAVPNLDGWGFRTFGEDWHGLHLPHHLLHFTPETLTRLVRKHGLTVRSITLSERPGWLRRSVKLAASKGKRLAWMLRSRLTLSLAARWSGWTGQGDDMHLLAEKPAAGVVTSARAA